jgi:hypothetical protein
MLRLVSSRSRPAPAARLIAPATNGERAALMRAHTRVLSAHVQAAARSRRRRARPRILHLLLTGRRSPSRKVGRARAFHDARPAQCPPRLCAYSGLRGRRCRYPEVCAPSITYQSPLTHASFRFCYHDRFVDATGSSPVHGAHPVTAASLLPATAVCASSRSSVRPSPSHLGEPLPPSLR